MAAEPRKPPPKGILKKPSTPPSVASSKDRPQPASDPREVAIQHARIIHHRLELEDTIADSIIELSKFPLSRHEPNNTYTASSPSPSDAAAFKTHIRLFQPSDYDDLIDERNANHICGYTLCPKPRCTFGGKGQFKLVNFGRKDFSIVERKELERWCSQACARRAMWIKVQLNETAAWERAGIESIQIELYEEPKKEADKELSTAEKIARDLAKVKLDADMKAVKDSAELALERGDVGANTSNREITVAIREKQVTGAVVEPTPAAGGDEYLLMEGYKTKFQPHQGPRGDDPPTSTE